VPVDSLRFWPRPSWACCWPVRPGDQPAVGAGGPGCVVDLGRPPDDIAVAVASDAGLPAGAPGGGAS